MNKFVYVHILLAAGGRDSCRLLTDEGGLLASTARLVYAASSTAILASLCVTAGALGLCHDDDGDDGDDDGLSLFG